MSNIDYVRFRRLVEQAQDIQYLIVKAGGMATKSLVEDCLMHRNEDIDPVTAHDVTNTVEQANPVFRVGFEATVWTATRPEPESGDYNLLGSIREFGSEAYDENCYRCRKGEWHTDKAHERSSSTGKKMAVMASHGIELECEEKAYNPSENDSEDFDFAQAKAYMQAFANRHKVLLLDDGEIGFGRPCVGYTRDGKYIAYSPYRFPDMTAVWDADNDVDFFPEGGIEDAYHKDDFFAVLIQDEDINEAWRQLYAWTRYLDDTLDVVLVQYKTGAQGMQLLLSGSVAWAFRPKSLVDSEDEIG